MKLLRNRIMTVSLVAALGVAGAACADDGAVSPGQEETGIEQNETGGTDLGGDTGTENTGTNAGTETETTG